MKRTLTLLLASALLPASARAQATVAYQVPEVVKKAFQTRFPAVKLQFDADGAILNRSAKPKPGIKPGS